MKFRRRSALVAATLTLSLLLSGTVTAATSESPAGTLGWQAALAQMPLAFVENRGQWDDSILFCADAGAATIWFTRGGVYYQFSRRSPGVESDRVKSLSEQDRAVTAVNLITASFPGATAQVQLKGEGQLNHRYNYFLGDDPSNWRVGVPAYAAVVFEDLYPGIDLKYYGRDGVLEYDFIATPGADLSPIRVHYGGTESVTVTETGELEVETDWAKVTERLPLAYQLSGTDVLPVATEYRSIDDHTFGFTYRDPIRADLALVIDPVLTYSTYLAGSGSDWANGVAVDASGQAFVVGQTASTNFPTQSPYQGDQGIGDAFVLKLNPAGDGLVFGTYLGGNSADEAYGVAVDLKGDAYIVGLTESTNFPVVNEFQSDQGSADGFVAKLSADGSTLIYSTYLGGSSLDQTNAVAVDGNGYAYTASTAYSSNFPTKNPYQTNQPGDDGAIVKLGQAGDSLVFGTYLGGNGIDFAYAIALDADENVYVTGSTTSSDFPTQGPYQTDQPSGDAYLAKLSADGSTLVYGTYLGGSDTDVGRDVAVDGSGQAFVAGHTASTDFPTQAPYQTDQPFEDAFLVKFNAAGDGLIYGTYLGGDSTDVAHGVALDTAGHAYVAGWTLSSNFPTVSPTQTRQDTIDAFVTIFAENGATLDYSTYLGGSKIDNAVSIAVATNGDAYVAGFTDSPDFITLDPFQTDQGGRDAFVLKLAYDATGIFDGPASERPDAFELVQNYPNPFNAETIVRFTLEQPALVNLTVYNVLGAKVATLCNRVLATGPQEVRWNGRDEAGNDLPTGVYLYRLRIGDTIHEQKMLLLK